MAVADTTCRRSAAVSQTSRSRSGQTARLEVAQTLLTRLEKEFFPRYGMIAFESDVRVLRPNKF